MKLKEKYNLGNIEEKARYVNEIAAELAKLESPVERELYAGKISSETGVSADSILSEISRLKVLASRFKKIDSFKKDFSSGAITGTNPKKANLLRAQKELLNLMCVDKSIFQEASTSLQSGDFEDGAIRDLFDLICDCYKKGKQPEAKLIVSQTENCAKIAEILHENQAVENKDLAAKEYINLILKENKAKKIFETAKSGDKSSEQKLLELDAYLRKEVRADE